MRVTYHPRDLGHLGRTSANAESKYDVIRMKDTVLVSTLHCNLPLSRVELLDVQNLGRGPNVDLERLSIELEPVGELIEGYSEQVLARTRYTPLTNLLRGCVYRPRVREPGKRGQVMFSEPDKMKLILQVGHVVVP